MAKRDADPLGLGKLQRRLEGGGSRNRTRYTIEVKREPAGLFSGFRGTLLLCGAVVLVLLIVSLAGGR